MTILDKIAAWLDRRELSRMRLENGILKAEAEARKARMEYLESRDTLCSQMANTINSQAFQIAKLKGVYDK